MKLKLWLMIIVATSAEAGEPDRAAYIREHYSKFEYRIPMRDGSKLFTAVYRPADRSREYPLLMMRTPYGASPYGASRYREKLGPDASFEREGFIFVIQDVRGRFRSEGEFVNMRPHVPDKQGTRFDESSDTYDTIEWLLENVEGHNGRVGMWGTSYPGFYAVAGAIDSHPALRAIAPGAPIADWFWDDMHHHGAFILPLTFNFFSSFGVAREGPTSLSPGRFEHGTPDGYAFFLELGPLQNVDRKYFKGEIAFWNDIVAHPNYDEFWQRRNILPHLRNVRAATLVVGGWFDTEDLYGPLKTYASIEKHNPKTFNALVMGPWQHGQWNRDVGKKVGEIEWGFPTSPGFQERVHLPFFLHHLAGAERPRIAEATAFETGANRWREFDRWPPAGETRHLYLREGGALALDAPPTKTGAAFDEFVSDPAKPVPHTMEITAHWPKDYVTEDQRFAAWRPDVLVYRSEPLEEDLTLAGPLRAELWVSTSRTAADWIVKVIDEHPGALPEIHWPKIEQAEIDAYPGGRQTLVRAEAMRGRFRESYEHPVPFVPGQETEVSFELWDVLHTFKRGHRVMIQIQSTWFPFVDRNPQTYVPNIFEAEASDFVRATHRVHRSPAHPSRIRVKVLP